MKQILFLDSAEELIKGNNYIVKNKKKGGITVSHFKVSDDNYKVLKRSRGDYYTITFSKEILTKYPKRIEKSVISVLKQLFTGYKYNKTLIVGLGNSDIPSDAIGPRTTNKIIATNHYNDFLTIPKVALFVPEVTSKTGINSISLIKMVVNNLKPDIIIVIDSLLTNKEQRLNTTIEVSDTGLIPGSALYTNREINAKTFGIPLIAIGIPLVIKKDNNLYTSVDINETLDILSNILSSSLNSLFLA